LAGALSIDLALRRWRDVGAAFVAADSAGVNTATVLAMPVEQALTLDTLVAAIDDWCERFPVRVIAIDGPLAWRDPQAHGAHARDAERELRCSGKTGARPDEVKPRPFRAFTEFSMALAEALIARGWPLVTRAHAAAHDRVLMETFPTATWRGLGARPLSGKARATAHDVAHAEAWLVERLAMRVIAEPSARGVPAAPLSHDALQAVVGGIAPAWWLAGLTDRVVFAGRAPFVADGAWREGHIVVARAPV
jgi:hypothetical protein